MNGGDDSDRRAYRLGAEAVARVVDRAWINPRPLAERGDSASHLGGARDRGRRRLGRVAARQMVVLPQLKRPMGRCALRTTIRSGSAERTAGSHD